MITVGLTGGIGSGKTTVAKVFELLGVPVFYADDVAKNIYREEDIREILTSRYQGDIYTGGVLNRGRLASIIFNDPGEKAFIESLIHPRVGDKYRLWKKEHSAEAYIIREAAILIESGAHKDCDQIILVTAPESMRIQRVVQRDGSMEEAVRKRMSLQWTDEQRSLFATQIWANDNRFPLLETILLFDNRLRA